MSLDLSLYTDESQEKKGSTGIFVRENGGTREITREEWERRFPGTEPVVAHGEEDDNEVWSGNITHNLTEMAKEAGIYGLLWRPEESGVLSADDLRGPLASAVRHMEADPERFRKHNADNGWGTYEDFLRFTREVLEACERYPHARVGASR